MSEQPTDPDRAGHTDSAGPTDGPGHTDIEVSELEVAANTEQPESNDPAAFTDDGTLGGLGGSDSQGGGAG